MRRAGTDRQADIQIDRRIDRLDRERALLVCADEGRTMRAEACDVRALLDLLDDLETER
jgi:hypothetical protein